MTRAALALVGAFLLAAPVVAQEAGDPEAGRQVFERQCTACHVVRSPDGEALAGRNGRTGPNLYGLPGREVASVEDFRYGRDMQALNGTGLSWDEAHFVDYVQDPTAWLRGQLEDDSARSRMAYRLRDEGEAHDVYAFLDSLAPAAE